mgnify:CR=1 FL=1
MALVLIGLVFLVAGWFARFWVGKREFLRRNGAGVEEFASYGGAVATKGFETLVRMLGAFSMFLGVMMLIIGTLLLTR